jgi:chromosome segregation ATPase
VNKERPYYRRRSTGAVVQLVRTDMYETGPAVCYLSTGIGSKMHLCTQEVLDREYELLTDIDPDSNLFVQTLQERIDALSAELAAVKHAAQVHERWVRIYRSQRLAPVKRLEKSLRRVSAENATLRRRLAVAVTQVAETSAALAGKGAVTSRTHALLKEAARERREELLDALRREQKEVERREEALSAAQNDNARLTARLRSGYSTLVDQHLDGLEANTMQEVLGLTLQSWVPLIIKIASMRERRCRPRTPASRSANPG